MVGQTNYDKYSFGISFNYSGQPSAITIRVRDVRFTKLKIDKFEPMPLVQTEKKGYRYGFNGMERDDELKGEGNSINYKYRMHDPKTGRFFSVDPLYQSFPWNSPYALSENRVVDAVELEGLESAIIHYIDLGNGKTKIHVVKDKSGEGFQL